MGPIELTVALYASLVPSLVVTSASIPNTFMPNFVNFFSADFISSTFDDNSQVMPLTADIVYDPEQTNIWHDVKGEFIPNIKDWIDNGAKDIFGNLPLEPNYIPEMRGCIAFLNGQTVTPLGREAPRGTIYIPSSSNLVDFWFSVVDDVQNPDELTCNQVKFSKNLFSFDNQPAYSLEVVTNPISE